LIPFPPRAVVVSSSFFIKGGRGGTSCAALPPPPRFKCSTPSVRIANTEFCRSKKNADESATTKSAFVLELKNFFFEEVVVVEEEEEETCFFLFERRVIFTRHAHVSCRCLLSVICLSRFGGEEAFFFSRAQRFVSLVDMCTICIYICARELVRARGCLCVCFCVRIVSARAQILLRDLCVYRNAFST